MGDQAGAIRQIRVGLVIFGCQRHQQAAGDGKAA
jgi:hypothetical protein